MLDKDIRYDISLKRKERGMNCLNWIKYQRKSFHIVTREKGRVMVRLKAKGRRLLKEIKTVLSS